MGGKNNKRDKETKRNNFMKKHEVEQQDNRMMKTEYNVGSWCANCPTPNQVFEWGTYKN